MLISCLISQSQVALQISQSSNLPAVEPVGFAADCKGDLAVDLYVVFPFDNDGEDLAASFVALVGCQDHLASAFSFVQDVQDSPWEAFQVAASFPVDPFVVPLAFGFHLVRSALAHGSFSFADRSSPLAQVHLVSSRQPLVPLVQLDPWAYLEGRMEAAVAFLDACPDL